MMKKVMTLGRIYTGLGRIYKEDIMNSFEDMYRRRTYPKGHCRNPEREPYCRNACRKNGHELNKANLDIIRKYYTEWKMSKNL